MSTDVKLPELGENVTSGDLVKVLVKVGDTIQKDQAILELETDKATIEVPSPAAGTVKEIHVKEGQKIKVGQSILIVEDGAGGKAAEERAPAKAEAKPAAEAEGKPEAKPAAKSEAKPQAKPDAESEEKPEADSQAKTTTTAKAAERVEAAREGADAAPTSEQKEAGTKPAASQGREELPPGARYAPTLSRTPDGGISPADVPAAPSVRQLAREIGVDITRVRGSGPGGRITSEDVKTAARERVLGSAAAGAVAAPVALPDFSKWGEVERQPMSAIRRATARHMGVAWQIPRVTQNEKADITAVEELRARYGKRTEAAGGKLTMTAIALKVIAAALKVYPKFACSIDLGKEEVIFKKYVNIGVAVDTERGLVVPVVRAVDQKNIVQLAAELAQLAEKARNRKLTPEEMEGGVFTITNLGSIGGTFFSPIINAPEVAILGIARAEMEPKWKPAPGGAAENGQFVPRLMLPLSLSYDHRIIDGAEAMRFLRWVAEALEQPFLLALEG